MRIHTYLIKEKNEKKLKSTFVKNRYNVTNSIKLI